MKTLLGLAWLICSIILATKWYKKSERNIIRMGNAMNRTQNKFWDWCYYLFLSLIVMGIPFGFILMIIRGIGVVAKYAIIFGVIGVVIYSIYCKIKHKENIIFSSSKKSANEKRTDESCTNEREE